MSSEYAALSDESSHNISRYRSIASVSLPVKFIPSIQEDLYAILQDSDVDEFKWKDLNSARYRFCAFKLIDYFINDMLGKEARVDVLIWDTHDDRHNIQARDDIKNFERMYFHLHRNLMNRREYEAVWYLCPDRRSAIDWQTIKQYLVDKGKLRKYFKHPLLKEEFSKIFFKLKTPCTESTGVRVWTESPTPL